ncbi:hypothetical protein MYX75_01075 [Acidobacteria bacterium AH-259-A15]|nr:hypothetical protein [Acidobacteria bacterium AH-259-A15]
MRASLYLADTFPTWFTDEEGIEHPVNGFIQVGTMPNGKVVLHAQPMQNPLDGMTVIKNGRKATWKWIDLKTDVPQVALHVLQDIWDSGKTDEDGNPIRERGPSARRQAILLPPAAIEQDLDPHNWMGDE